MATTRAAGARRNAAPAAGTPPPLTEELWQGWIADLARQPWCGWHAAHFRPALTKHGWRTAGSFDAKGFPDLVLIHPERQLVLYREIKSDAGRLEPDQERWRDWLTAAGADYDVWRPADRPEVVRILTGGRLPDEALR